MELTLRWAERSKKYFEEHKKEVPWDQVQSPVSSSSEAVGNPTPETRNGDDPGSFWHCAGRDGPRHCRKESAERTIEIDFPGYAIGGLSVGEPRALTREIVESTLEHLPADKPRYLMGVGTPEEIVEYANLGIDMMDCVLPTRAARHGLLFTSEGKISIKQARYAGDEARSTQIVAAGCAALLPSLSAASLCIERGLGPSLKYRPQPELLP